MVEIIYIEDVDLVIGFGVVVKERVLDCCVIIYEGVGIFWGEFIGDFVEVGDVLCDVGVVVVLVCVGVVEELGVGVEVLMFCRLLIGCFWGIDFLRS